MEIFALSLVLLFHHCVLLAMLRRKLKILHETQIGSIVIVGIFNIMTIFGVVLEIGIFVKIVEFFFSNSSTVEGGDGNGRHSFGVNSIFHVDVRQFEICIAQESAKLMNTSF